MSKLSEKLQKLKERRRTNSPSSSSSPSRGLPSFRFSTADEEITEIIDQFDCDDDAVLESKLRIELKDETPPSEEEKDQNLRETSPLKETLLNKFSSKFSQSTPNTSSINDGDLPPLEKSSQEDLSKQSWLHTVKGKIAKTVEEKYTEYKNEKEMRKLMNNPPNNLECFDDLLLEQNLETEDSEDQEKLAKSLPHSFSEESTLNQVENEDAMMALGARRSSTPVSTEEIQRSNPQSPKEKRRFTFSFLEKKPQTGEAESVQNTPQSSDKSAPGNVTPTKSSLRSRMMERIMGKSPHASSIPIPIDSKITYESVKAEDPFSGLDMTSSASPDKQSPELFGSYHDDSDIETAMEVDEFYEPGPELDGTETLTSQLEEVVHEEAPSVQVTYQNYWWSFGLPLCLLLFFQLLPLPSWCVGFLTGILIGIPTATYVTYTFMDDNMPRTPFMENLHRKKVERPAIIVQEELKRIYTWMNLWPHKKGPYDPLTYDVRRTISVRIMLHGPWLEMRFPKRNMPLRRMYNDKEPTNVQFHEHVEVIDLSTCSIDIQPENLPTKRIWSKKYPIRIRTNTRKPYSTQEATKQMAAAADIKDEAELDLDGEEIMLDAKEDFSDNEDMGCDNKVNKTLADESSLLAESENENRVFYLFTRTAREKEEWFNHLLVAAKFMEDWERQNPKEGSPIDPDYQTQKVREQMFKMFMEDYPQAKNEDEAKKRHEEIKQDQNLFKCAKDQVAFLNIFFGRMWHDLHNNREFIEFLREKLTRKLLKVKISQYFENVQVTTLDLGPKLPQITSVSTPWQDELGTWVDLDIEYKCICQATVQTQGIRLPAKDEPDREAAELLSRQAAILESDEEDSAEVYSKSWHNSSYLNNSSLNSFLKEDDDLPDQTENENGSGPTTPGHELPPLPGFKARLMEGILRSDFVAKMAESEWVKKNITSKNITLQLQLHSIKGTLRVNFPPAPSDRIWYGFREPPYLDLALRPCFGGHSLGKYEGTISTVMKHLEKRLKLEFIKVLVCPNMDDEVLPFLHHVPYSLTGTNSNQQPTSIYVPKIKPSQSLQGIRNKLE